MRIDAYNAVNQVYQTSKTSALTKQQQLKTQSDKLEISQTAKSIQIAKEAVEAAPDVREDKVAQIKAKMAAGMYNVSSSEIADKIISSSMTVAF